jgi:lipoprotein Spr
MKKSRFIQFIVIVVCCASCKSWKNFTAKDNSSAATKQTSKKREVKFIDNVSMTPGSHEIATNGATGNKVKTHYSQPDAMLTNFNIEKADWLQLKYAIIMDETVERLTNIGLLQEIDHWWGTRYCMGGVTENCIDCSGLSSTIERDVYGINVPRTAQEQYDSCLHIEQADLREGDLVFFQTSGRGISHVGVYLTNNKFVHAATSGGVMISDLNDKYWQQRFKGAGRYNK